MGINYRSLVLTIAASLAMAVVILVKTASERARHDDSATNAWDGFEVLERGYVDMSGTGWASPYYVMFRSKLSGQCFLREFSRSGTVGCFDAVECPPVNP